MDNITHSLVGLVAAKAGLERTSPYATAVCIIAANLPDADVVMLLSDQWTYLEHHRGITHSIVGVAVLSLLLPLGFFAGDRLLARFAKRAPRARLPGLLLASLLLSASHPLLDWTNSYGLRPLLPWDGRWFYGDLVFIVDPWIWLLLGGAAFLLTARTNWRLAAWTAFAVLLSVAILLLPQRAGATFPLVVSVMWFAGLSLLVVMYRAGAAVRWGGKVGVVALSLVVAYWGALALVHRRAQTRAEAVAREIAARNGETVLRVAATPTLADPFTWLCLTETDRSFGRFNLNLNDERRAADGGDVLRFEKPQELTPALLEEALTDRRVRIFLDFARFPAARLNRNCAGDTLLQLADLRYTAPGGNRRGNFSLEVALPGGRETKAEASK